MGRVVVTGASGSLGTRVVRLLADLRPGDVPGAERPRVVALDIVPPSEPVPGVEFVVADLADPADGDRVAAAVHGADAVIHLAWRTADTVEDGPAEEAAAAEANLAALRRVLAVAAKAGAGHLTLVSSATVYGAWPDNPVPLSEDAPLRPVPSFSYAVTKAEAERIVAAWADDHPRTAVAVLRPTVTVGSPERALYQALGGIRSPRGDDSGRPVQFVHADDLASAVLTAWAGRLTGVYNVAPDRGIGEATARALAGGVARVPLPSRVAHAVAAWTWNLWRIGSPREAQAYARWPWAIAPDRLLAAGWQPQHTSEEALVAADDRAHWDDLPPGRRQNLTVLVALLVVVAVAGAVGGVLVARRRRLTAQRRLVRRLTAQRRLVRRLAARRRLVRRLSSPSRRSGSRR
jgi:nucleoside-diphosphate-sugar epimerase